MQTFKKEPMQSPNTNAYHLKKIGIIKFQSGLYHTTYPRRLLALTRFMPSFFTKTALGIIALVGGFREKIKIDIVKARFCLIIGS